MSSETDQPEARTISREFAERLVDHLRRVLAATPIGQPIEVVSQIEGEAPDTVELTREQAEMVVAIFGEALKRTDEGDDGR